MKRFVFLKLAALTLLAVVAVTGCKKTPKNVTPIHGSATRVDGAGENETPKQPTTDLTPGDGLTAKKLPTGVPVELIGNNPPSNFKPVDPNGAIPGGELGMFEGRPMDRSAFAANTVHFEYDRAIVKASEVGKLKPVIAALKASPQNMLLIEGHCDERGTEEYNRSLGERRAQAVRTHLVKGGISPDRLRTLSYGEDKPAELGHTEAAWAKNRRGELVLLKPRN